MLASARILMVHTLFTQFQTRRVQEDIEILHYTQHLLRPQWRHLSQNLSRQTSHTSRPNITTTRVRRRTETSERRVTHTSHRMTLSRAMMITRAREVNFLHFRSHIAKRLLSLQHGLSQLARACRHLSQHLSHAATLCQRVQLHQRAHLHREASQFQRAQAHLHQPLLLEASPSASHWRQALQ